MNGRIYDPLLGRFLSADPYIPDFFVLQAYNRYSYVYNNPLSLSDPSGHWPVLTGLYDWMFPKNEEKLEDEAVEEDVIELEPFVVTVDAEPGSLARAQQINRAHFWREYETRLRSFIERTGREPRVFEAQEMIIEVEELTGMQLIPKVSSMPPIVFPTKGPKPRLRLKPHIKEKLRKIREFGPNGLRQVTGSVTRDEGRQMAEEFVGEGFTENVNSNGVWVLRSQDGLRQVRGPSMKPTDQGRNVHPTTGLPFSRTGQQMNFETRSQPSGSFETNVHVDVE
jgi:hypothetical protein